MCSPLPPSLTHTITLPSQTAALFDRYDTDGNGRFLYQQFSKMLCGAAPDVAGDCTLRSIIQRFRQKVLETGGMFGIRTLSKMFQQLGAERMRERDFYQGLREVGVELDGKASRAPCPLSLSVQASSVPDEGVFCSGTGNRLYNGSF